MMELGGVAMGTILHYKHGKIGRIYTDQQGLFRKLTETRCIRLTGLIGGASLTLHNWNILQAGLIDLP